MFCLASKDKLVLRLTQGVLKEFFAPVPFSPPFLLILAFQPILFHTAVTEEEFFKKSRAELFDCGVANDMSQAAHMLVCIMSTPCFCFARFSLLWIISKLILPGVTRD